MIFVELKKVWRKKFFIKLLVFMMIAMIGLKYYQMNYIEMYTANAYQKLAKDLEGLNEKEIDAFFQAQITRNEALSTIATLDIDVEVNEEVSMLIKNYQDDYDSGIYPYYEDTYDLEQRFLKDMYAQFKVIENYPQMRKDIDDKAKQLQSISLFQTNENTMASILKTAKDYNKIAMHQIDFHINKGFEVAFMDFIPFLMVLLMMFPLIYLLFFEECETGLLYLMKSTAKGRWNTITAKLFALLISILILLLLFYGGSFLFSIWFYPDIMWDAPIQSITSFNRSVLPISISAYLGLFLFVKWMMCFLVGLLFAYLLQKTKNYVISILLILSVLVIEYIAYTILLSTGSFVILKYVNLYVCLDVHAMFASYYNMLLFNHVFTLNDINILFILVCLLILLTLNIHYFLTHKEIYHKKAYPRFKSRMRPHSFQFYSVYKVLYSQKIIFVLLCFIVVGVQRINVGTLTSSQMFEQSYIQELKHLSTNEKAKYIEEKKTYFQNLLVQKEEVNRKSEHGEISDIEASMMQDAIDLKLKAYPIFVKVDQQYQETVNDDKKTLLYEDGYVQLFLNTDDQLLLLMFVVLILMVPATLFMDKQKSMKLVLNSTPLGKEKKEKIQWRICYITSILLVVFISMKDLYEVMNTYGLTDGFAYLNNISIYEHVSFPISIISFYLLGLLIKIYFIISFTYFIYTLSCSLNKLTQVYLCAFIGIFSGLCLSVLHFSTSGLNIITLFHLPYSTSFSLWLFYPFLLVLLCKGYQKRERILAISKKMFHQ